jgi:hypothetical protein
LSTNNHTNLRICITLALLCFSLFSFAQDKEKKIPKHRTKFSIGITGSPDIYIYNFKIDSTYNLSYQYKYNYSYGLTFVYYPIKLISLRVALLYSTKGYTVDYNYSAKNPNPAFPQRRNFNVAYLDIPLILHFNLIHKDRIQLFLSAGIVPGILISKAAEIVYKDSTSIANESQNKNFNSLLAGTAYSLGLKYNLSPRIGLGIEPYFRYYLNRIDKTMSQNPISFGAKFALYINLYHKHHKDTPWGTL